MTIRAATEDDIPRILEIENETITPPWTHGALLSEIYRDDCFFAVSYVGGHESRTCGFDDIGGHEARTCGFVILRRMSEDEGELLQIAVDKTARRRGVADKLMGAAMRYSEVLSIRRIFLEVRKGNETAIALYKKHGFVNVRVRKDYYSDPTEDAVVMVRGN